ncbi:MAG: hypothetical protein PWQ55_2082 [Chloroflexota bacterium]|nr:hypothetical protein [Chloroflexota bacterium]
MTTHSSHPEPDHHDSRTRLWRAADFGGLEMIHAHLQDFHFSPHTHSEFMIAATVSGWGQPHLQGKSTPIRSDDIILLNPGDVQSGANADDTLWIYRGFYPPVRMMQLAAQALQNTDHPAPRFRYSVAHDPRLAARLRSLHRCLENPQDRLRNESLLLHTLAQLLERYGNIQQDAQTMGHEHYAVRQAKEYLHAQPGQNVSLEELAQVANLSPYYFCRVFHRETGFSPHHYQLLVRLQYAKGLLAKGLPIAQAALQAGFYDQAHFTRHFKRIYAVSPNRFFPNADTPSD